MSVVTNNSIPTVRPFNTKGTTQNDALEALVKLVVPDQKTKESVQAAIKKPDWTGRVIANININRNAARPILLDAAAFKFFKKRAVQEISKVIGSAFFVKVQMVDVEEGLKMQYFVKVRVSKKNVSAPASTPPPPVAPVPQVTPEELALLVRQDALRRFEEAQQKIRESNTVARAAAGPKNRYAILGFDSDDE